MKLEIKYHRLQAKIAAMKADFTEQTKAIRKENSSLRTKNKELAKRLENAHNMIESEKEANRGWRSEKKQLLKEIMDLKKDIAQKDALIRNMETACKVSPNDVWKIKEFPELRKRYLEAVVNRRY